MVLVEEEPVVLMVVVVTVPLELTTTEPYLSFLKVTLEILESMFTVVVTSLGMA